MAHLSLRQSCGCFEYRYPCVHHTSKQAAHRAGGILGGHRIVRHGGSGGLGGVLGLGGARLGGLGLAALALLAHLGLTRRLRVAQPRTLPLLLLVQLRHIPAMMS